MAFFSPRHSLSNHWTKLLESANYRSTEASPWCVCTCMCARQGVLNSHINLSDSINAFSIGLGCRKAGHLPSAARSSFSKTCWQHSSNVSCVDLSPFACWDLWPSGARKHYEDNTAHWCHLGDRHSEIWLLWDRKRADSQGIQLWQRQGFRLYFSCFVKVVKAVESKRATVRVFKWLQWLECMCWKAALKLKQV